MFLLPEQGIYPALRIIQIPIVQRVRRASLHTGGRTPLVNTMVAEMALLNGALFKLGVFLLFVRHQLFPKVAISSVPTIGDIVRTGCDAGHRADAHVLIYRDNPVRPLHDSACWA